MSVSGRKDYWLKRDTQDVEGQYVLQTDGNGKLSYWDYRGGIGLSFSSVGTVTDNQWRHVAFVRNGNNGYLYINGINDGSSSATAKDISAARDLAFAHNHWDGGGYFSGSLDEIEIHNVARSPAWIWACWRNAATNDNTCGAVTASNLTSAVANGSSWRRRTLFIQRRSRHCRQLRV